MTVPAPGEASAAAQAPLNYLENIDLAPAVLGANGVFTSEVIDLGALSARVGSFARWRLFISSDQAGTANMQQSTDGVTWYTTQSNSYAAGGQGAIYESLVALRFLRVAYTNGAVAQAAFRALVTLVAI